MPAQFDRSIEYIVKNELDEKPLTGKTNPETWQLWKQGYVVLKKLHPQRYHNNDNGCMEDYRNVSKTMGW